MAFSLDSKPPLAYAAIYKPGRHWVERLPLLSQPYLADHFEYVTSLHRIGASHILLGGPFEDRPGALMISRAPSLEAAWAFVEADPVVRQGVVQVEIRPLRLSLAALEAI
jgi:uncharacterized protein YciI